MEHLHIDAVLFFMLVVKALPILSLDLHHSNNKSYKLLRLIRSATAIGSLNQTRAPSITNCYNSTCVLNEEYCNESKKGCERCLYEDGECTANWDCFNVCSEKKAQEICKGLEAIYIWILIFSMAVAVVALSVAFIVILVSRRQKSNLLPDARTEQGENQEKKPLMKKIVEADSVSEYSELPKEPNSLSSNSSSGHISQPEDSVHGKDAASSGPPPYSNESKKSKEALQEYQKCMESKTPRPIQRQSNRTPSPESESVSNPTLAMSGELVNTSLFVSSSEGHIPERNHCCRELESTKSDK